MTIDLKVLAPVLPLVTLAIAEDAHADDRAGCPGPYYDPCEGYDGWLEVSLLSTGTIPSDGVLVLQASWRGPVPPGPETITLTADGNTDAEPLTGTTEATEFPGVFIWRPDGAWTGSLMTISGVASNAGVASECLLAELPIAGEVMIDAAPGAALTPVDIDAVEMFELVPQISLETMACCPGATPTYGYGGCYSEPGVDFDPSQCTPIAATGVLRLTLTGTPAATGPVAQQVMYVLRLDGDDVASFDPTFGLAGPEAPQCASIDAVDLGSKAAVKGAEECFGATFAEQVGPQALDPTAALSCELQVCAVEEDGDQWDLEMCTPFGGSGDVPTEGGGEETGGTDGTDDEGRTSDDESGGQDDDKGCACDATGGPPGLLALAGLALLGRRRRR